MEFQTKRFGVIDVDETRVIRMKGGILGFEHLLTYTLLIQDPHNPLWWLQSLDDDSLAFVVTDPLVIQADYHPEIPKAALAFLGISREETLSLLSIVTVRSQPFRVTVNLRAPLVINAETRVGGQIVLEDEQYQIRHEIIPLAAAERRLAVASVAGP
ncbi:MAG: flagellar assembly protein FliW [Syntrophales bacterium]